MKGKKADKAYVFSCKIMVDLKNAICDETDWSRGKIMSKQFDDKTPKIRIRDPRSIRGRFVVYICSFRKSKHITKQMAEMMALLRYGARELLVIVPFFPHGTMDRVVNPGDAVTADSLAAQLSSLATATGRPVSIFTMELHDIHVVHYFKGVIAHNERLMHQHLSHLKPEETVIAFPDLGAAKRYKKLFVKNGFDTVQIYKEDHSASEMTLVSGNPSGRHVTIIDDLAQTLGTAWNCGKLLKTRGASSVSLACVHGVLPTDSALDRLSDGMFEQVYFFDTIPQNGRLEGKKNVTILPIQQTVQDLIQLAYY